MVEEKIAQGTLDAELARVRALLSKNLNRAKQPVTRPPFLMEDITAARRRDDSIHRGASLIGGKRSK